MRQCKFATIRNRTAFCFRWNSCFRSRTHLAARSAHVRRFRLTRHHDLGSLVPNETTSSSLDRLDSRDLAAARLAGSHVFHTREGHRPDLSDLPANKRWCSQRIGAGSVIQVPADEFQYAANWAGRIIAELAPLPGELIIDKTVREANDRGIECPLFGGLHGRYRSFQP